MVEWWTSQCSDTHQTSCSLNVFGRGRAPYAQQEVQTHQKRCQQPQDNAEGTVQPCNMVGSSPGVSVQDTGRSRGVLPCQPVALALKDRHASGVQFGCRHNASLAQYIAGCQLDWAPAMGPPEKAAGDVKDRRAGEVAG